MSCNFFHDTGVCCCLLSEQIHQSLHSHHHLHSVLPGGPGCWDKNDFSLVFICFLIERKRLTFFFFVPCLFPPSIQNQRQTYFSKLNLGLRFAPFLNEKQSKIKHKAEQAVCLMPSSHHDLKERDNQMRKRKETF